MYITMCFHDCAQELDSSFLMEIIANYDRSKEI